LQTFLLLGLTVALQVSATPTGAPPSACEDMSPEHADAEEQPGAAPYHIMTSVLEKEKKFESIHIIIF